MKFTKIAKLSIVAASALVAFYLASPLEPRMRVTLALLIMTSSLWITEALPLGVTALVIALSQPLLGIQPFQNALQPFFDPVIALFLGALFLAMAFEKQDLDEVLAYRISDRLGNSVKPLALGMMLIAAFLAMWMTITFIKIRIGALNPEAIGLTKTQEWRITSLGASVPSIPYKSPR
jgi:sodium-dependent dicarboxylate transporter 2/3/5